jgi:hypothetical protein
LILRRGDNNDANIVAVVSQKDEVGRLKQDFGARTRRNLNVCSKRTRCMCAARLFTQARMVIDSRWRPP